MIDVRGVSFSYGRDCILQDASIAIPDHSIVALHGRSGIGKSTLARLLTGMLLPASGTIEMDGKVLSKPGRKYDRKLGLGIQMVYQQPHLSLDPKEKVGESLVEIIRYHHMAPRGKEKEKALEMLLSVGLGEEVMGHLPMQISGGEAQRVALAKALLFSPRLLILDEATSMLDMSTQANVLGLVKRKMEETGGSVLLITHYMKLAEKYADSIYLVENKTLRKIER